MFPSIIQRSHIPPNGMLFDFENNPYKAKKQWPPDFSKLSDKHQFRLERRYRKRTQLAWSRPGWKKGTQLVQWGAILFVLGYGVLYMDWGQQDKENPPFKAARQWYNGLADSIWTQSTKKIKQDTVKRNEDAHYLPRP